MLLTIHDLEIETVLGIYPHEQQLRTFLVQLRLTIIPPTNDDIEQTIDYDLINEDEIQQNAITFYHRLQTSEIDLAFGKHQTSRYCLVEAIPETGRMHQLRKHFKHILHPILGCRPYGCNKQNKLWLENFELKPSGSLNPFMN